MTTPAVAIVGPVKLGNIATGAATVLDALNEALTINNRGASTVGIDVTGTFVGTWIVEGTIDGTSWRALPYVNPTTAEISTAGTGTGTGYFLAGCAGYQQIRVRCSAYTSGSMTVAMESSPGTNLVFLTGLAAVREVAHTLGGCSVDKLISAASTNGANVKSSAGQVYGVYLSCVNAAARYYKLYDKATSPTVGTDTPKMTFLIPGNFSNAASGAGAILALPTGVPFTAGICRATTTGVADSDTGAVASNEIVANLFYK